MNLYMISQTVNNGYDSYDSAIVCAEDGEAARDIMPDDYMKNWEEAKNAYYTSWVRNREDVEVRYLGIADENVYRGVVLASFNAG